nr:restriction endonuclease subunit S [Lacticaseibacillus rhamnosus]
MGELANIRRGASPRPIKNKKWFSQTSQVGWIRISDVTEQNGRIHQVEQHLSDAGQKKTLVLKSKHLLLSIAATVGKPVQNYIQVGVHDGFIVFMDPKFDLDFMFYFLEKYRPNWARFGQPGSQININSELVRDLVVSIPTAHEQVAVAQFIITLDNLIAATQDKLEKLSILQRGFLQHFFAQTWRFSGYSHVWENHRLGDVATRVRGNDGRMNLPILTISAGKGWLTQEQRFSQNIAGNELKKYTLLSKGELSYNHGNSKLAEYGAVFVLKQFKEALVPRVYHSFNVSGKADPDFIEYLFESGVPNHELRKLISSGARMDGLLNINYDSFMNISVLLPSIEEQNKIARVLEKLKKLTDETRLRLFNLQQAKKSLLRMLFP